MTGTDSVYRPPIGWAEEFLNSSAVPITAEPGVWQDVGLTIAVPRAGTYEVTAEAQGVVNYTAGTIVRNVAIAYRLFNLTDGIAVPRSQRIAFLASAPPTTTIGHHGGPSLRSFIQVTAPAEIGLQHMRYASGTGGTFTVSETRGNDNALGDTAIHWVKIR